MEISYEFWESIEERAKRLEGIWQLLKKDKEAKELSEAQLHDAIGQAVSKLRSLRWKVDQMLEKDNVDPIFKEHYLTYTREEFLFDTEVNYHKIKALVNRAPKQLQQDPEVGPYFKEIFKLLKKVEVPEDSSPGYFDTEGTYHWNTTEKTREKFLKGIPDAFPDEIDPSDLIGHSESLVDPEGTLNETQETEQERKKLQLISELKSLVEGEFDKDNKKAAKKANKGGKKEKSKEDKKSAKIAKSGGNKGTKGGK